MLRVLLLVTLSLSVAGAQRIFPSNHTRCAIPQPPPGPVNGTWSTTAVTAIGQYLLVAQDPDNMNLTTYLRIVDPASCSILSTLQLSRVCRSILAPYNDTLATLYCTPYSSNCDPPILLASISITTGTVVASVVFEATVPFPMCYWFKTALDAVQNFYFPVQITTAVPSYLALMRYDPASGLLTRMANYSFSSHTELDDNLVTVSPDGSAFVMTCINSTCLLASFDSVTGAPLASICPSEPVEFGFNVGAISVAVSAYESALLLGNWTSGAIASNTSLGLPTGCTATYTFATVGLFAFLATSCGENFSKTEITQVNFGVSPPQVIAAVLVPRLGRASVAATKSCIAVADADNDSVVVYPLL